MKLAACFLTLLPGFAVAASWTSPGFPAFSEQGTGTFVSHAQLPKGTRPLMLNFDQQCWQPADAIKLNQMLSLQPCSNTPPQWRLFRDGEDVYKRQVFIPMVPTKAKLFLREKRFRRVTSAIPNAKVSPLFTRNWRW